MYTNISDRLYNDISGLGTDLCISDKENYISEHRKQLEELTKMIYIYSLESGDDPYSRADFYILNNGFNFKRTVNAPWYTYELDEEEFFDDHASPNESEYVSLYSMFSLAKAALHDFDFTNAYQKNGFYIIRILNHIFMVDAATGKTNVIVKTSENEHYWFDDYLDVVGCTDIISGPSMVDVIECLEKINTSTLSEDMHVIVWCLIRLVYCYRTFDSCGVITP